MDELVVILQPEIPNTLTKGEQRQELRLISGEMKYVWMNAEKPDDRIEVPWYRYGQQDDPSKAFEARSDVLGTLFPAKALMSN